MPQSRADRRCRRMPAAIMMLQSRPQRREQGFKMCQPDLSRTVARNSTARCDTAQHNTPVTVALQPPADHSITPLALTAACCQQTRVSRAVQRPPECQTPGGARGRGRPVPSTPPPSAAPQRRAPPTRAARQLRGGAATGVGMTWQQGRCGVGQQRVWAWHGSIDSSSPPRHAPQTEQPWGPAAGPCPPMPPGQGASVSTRPSAPWVQKVSDSPNQLTCTAIDRNPFAMSWLVLPIAVSARPSSCGGQRGEAACSTETHYVNVHGRCTSH